jgi:hypothetical protein
MRLRALFAVPAVLLSLLLAFTAASASAAVPDKKAPACAGKAKKTAIAAIEVTFGAVLDGTTEDHTLDEKLSLIEGSDDSTFRTMLDEVAATNADALTTTSVEVESVTCTGKRTADVLFELVLDGEPERGLAPPGGAVVEDGLWKITRATVCHLVALADPMLLEGGPCGDALAARI